MKDSRVIAKTLGYDSNEGSSELTYCRSEKTAYATHWLTKSQQQRYEATPVVFADEIAARGYMEREWGYSRRVYYSPVE